ncbi:MAG: DUF721 domain-containing protein [Zetaproteobacteria bacterium]|nr:DUF721 domain-containing protein [Zetaproteobacteria bacterium]
MKQPKRPRSQLLDAQDHFANILGEQRFQTLSMLARIRRDWPGIVGTMLASHSEPVFFEYAEDHSYTLIIGITHPNMAQQIRFLHEQIISACQDRAGLRNLRDLRTRIQSHAGISPAKKSIVKSSPLPLTIRKKIALSLPNINNHPLRLAMFQAQVAHIQFLGDQHP